MSVRRVAPTDERFDTDPGTLRGISYLIGLIRGTVVTP